ncbi:type I-C CRISPR-associated endonuclease Cas1c [Magnetococcales bacterium HHB-1]
MHQLLNTLYVMTQGAYLRLERETVRVEVEKKVRLRIPFHHLRDIVVFGNVLVSPFLLHRCADDGRVVIFLSQSGRFKARVEGGGQGNILLRIAHFEFWQKPESYLVLVRSFLAGKLQNSRLLLLRAARDASQEQTSLALREVAEQLASLLRPLSQSDDLERIRGIEGQAAKSYFSVLDQAIKVDREHFLFQKRTRRPPKDRVNALLSFFYALLLSDCQSALESVGLDPQLGFLHTIRSGRPGLALDLMEEFRSIFADRLAISLINRRIIKKEHFDKRVGDAVLLNEEGRKKVVGAYQKHKQKAVLFPALKSKVPWGLVPLLQARLLSRHIRSGGEERYQPFLPK